MIADPNMLSTSLFDFECCLIVANPRIQKIPIVKVNNTDKRVPLPSGNVVHIERQLIITNITIIYSIMLEYFIFIVSGLTII